METQTAGATAELVRISDSAAKKILALMAKHPESDGLRIQVRGGGCSGMQYEFSVDKLRERDRVVEHNGARVLIDPKSAIYVRGSNFNYVKNLMEERFEIKNPNVKSTCGCGTSFRI
ncbi:MAG: Iron-sulfur cluster insertion protein ErpA [Candidatus Latescibacteria bacterium ADurb.Bin168]|nr:MAG: Iron-sulfur cluster insertion protein ErpA [Candidatus Latescibacteria bacterium ADurb.Bin168]